MRIDTVGLLAFLCGACPVALFGCHHSSEGNTTDLAIADGADHDGASGTSCFDIFTCVSGCTNPSCLGSCVAAGSTQAQTDLLALIACGYSHCLADGGVGVDGGAGPCSSTSDASAGCVVCITAEAQGAHCSEQLNACTTD